MADNQRNMALIAGLAGLGAKILEGLNEGAVAEKKTRYKKEAQDVWNPWVKQYGFQVDKPEPSMFPGVGPSYMMGARDGGSPSVNDLSSLAGRLDPENPYASYYLDLARMMAQQGERDSTRRETAMEKREIAKAAAEEKAKLDRAESFKEAMKEFGLNDDLTPDEFRTSYNAGVRGDELPAITRTDDVPGYQQGMKRTIATFRAKAQKADDSWSEPFQYGQEIWQYNRKTGEWRQPSIPAGKGKLFKTSTEPKQRLGGKSGAGRVAEIDKALDRLMTAKNNPTVVKDADGNERSRTYRAQDYKDFQNEASVQTEIDRLKRERKGLTGGGGQQKTNTGDTGGF